MEVSQLDTDQILVQTPQGTETVILDTYRNTNSVFFVHNNVKKLPSKVGCFRKIAELLSLPALPK